MRDVDRRRFLTLGAAALAGAVVQLPSTSESQIPKRGEIFRICLASDPIGFDPHLSIAASTFICLSCTHSRLVRHRAGPDVVPGTLRVEGDLAESWVREGDISYVFTLRKGVRWHNKPPVNGRELTAEDVKYSYDRFRTIEGNGFRTLLEEVQRIDVLDRHRLRFTLRAPFAWLVDSLASTVTWIVPREAIERWGDLRRPEACIGTGPWMLERYDPNVRCTFVRNPEYFVPGLPYVDGIDFAIDGDPSSRLASWLSGHYDFAPEYGMVVRRLDLDIARRRRPGLQTAEYISLLGMFVAVKLDQAPFRDVRVRRAMAMAGDWKELLAASPYALGHGAPNPAVPAGLTEWSIPVDQLTPLGRRLSEEHAADGRRLLADAGYPTGFKTTLESTAYSTDYLDSLQVALTHWKAIGIDIDLRLKERGAFLATGARGRFDRTMASLRGLSLFPDPYLAGFHLPGDPLNLSGVEDPRLTQMIRLQRRTFEPNRRRELVFDIQRYLAEQAYYLYAGPSAKVVAGWEPYVRNFGPNLGNDYGGRLVAAWIDRA